MHYLYLFDDPEFVVISDAPITEVIAEWAPEGAPTRLFEKTPIYGDAASFPCDRKLVEEI